ncbi:Mobile element protein [Dissulfuribacter thermophilus]|uniref:Mobile element protein n=1 Tax=Dissulfuribacter thermophilus TaxID=1156395 RepID=A0A1B9F9W8_9BACT|nr:hypothetical protein [Dissulfuribacter thermophilus]OCC16571.1 Mobile element protein [Dissulfuribacter thermophilus]
MDLFIIDEIGFKKVPQDAVDEFFETEKRRHENGPSGDFFRALI